jgi:PIN domain nuclease of toxin-antitoxin system
VILLDTNALIWLFQQHKRARPLAHIARRYISPASILELQFLVEVGKLRFEDSGALADIAADDRWTLDEPPSVRWFAAAAEVGWTRDPFDRLIAAHARLRHWKLATGDTALVEHLGASRTLAL